MARILQREDRPDRVGGIDVSHHRPPAWLVVAIGAIIGWAVWYLITFSISSVGTFRAPGGSAAWVVSRIFGG